MISSPVPPNLRSLLDAFKQEVFFDLNCHAVGTITAFNATLQTASVQISIPRVVGGRLTPGPLPTDPPRWVGGKVVPYPLLTDCPVFVPSGGGAALTFPIAAGDPCLVLFNDRDIDNWFTTGNSTPPNSARMHSLSDGLVLVGVRSKANPLANYSTTDAQLRCGGGAVGVGPNSKVDIHSSAGSLLDALNGTITSLDALCSALVAWVDTRGDTPNPATIAAINAVKSDFDANKVAIDDVLK